MPTYTQTDALSVWRTYLDKLTWQRGSLDSNANLGFLRAASLGISAQDAFDEITCRCREAGDWPRPAKLAHQVRSAYAHAGNGRLVLGKGYRVISAQPKWPASDFTYIEKVLIWEPRLGLVDLWECSPCRFGDDQPHAEPVIDVLFPNNPAENIDPLLCIGWGSGSSFKTKRREQWRGNLDRLEFIVSSPMLTEWGRTQEGKLSQHTLEATGKRVYQVIEFDFSTDTPQVAFLCRGQDCDCLDLSAALHWYLGTMMPLVCVTFSGGKSLHGWYRVFERSEPEQRAFMNEAVLLGADPHTWNRSQFVRLPGGTRYENNSRQTVFYLNPKNAVTL